MEPRTYWERAEGDLTEALATVAELISGGPGVAEPPDQQSVDRSP